MVEKRQSRRDAVSGHKRELILDAAKQIFAAEGLEGASLRAIEEFNCLLREMPGPLGNRADGKHSRLTQILRAIDGRRAGGSYRDIATVLFGAKRVREDWKDGEHLKNHVRRLVHRGEMFVDGGYRRFLRQGF